MLRASAGPSGSLKRPLSVVAAVGLAGVALVIGAAVVAAPPLAWAALGAALGLAALNAPPQVWIGAAVAAGSGSRVFVAAQLAPAIVNFFHFPLALGAFLIASTRGGPQTIAGSLRFGCVLLLMLAGSSWLLRGGEVVRPLLAWLVIAEPFLIVAALDRLPTGQRPQRFAFRLAIAIAVLQLAWGLWQAVTLGFGDVVQGTFVGMGAGAHVAGAVALVGSLLCFARGLTERDLGLALAWLAGGILLGVVPAVADAKQALVAFAPAVLWLMIAAIRLGRVRPGVLLLFAGLLLWGGSAYYRLPESPADPSIVREGLIGKAQALVVIVGKMTAQPGGWFFGLGPGNSVSRVALMGLEGYIKPDSPVSALALAPAETSQEIWDLTFSHWLTSASSVWSGFSSWMGLFGDLGLAGIAAYLWLGWMVWRRLSCEPSWPSLAARAVLIMSGVLGALYNWLEEPGFTLVAAVVVGLGLLAGKGDDAPLNDPARP